MSSSVHFPSISFSNPHMVTTFSVLYHVFCMQVTMITASTSTTCSASLAWMRALCRRIFIKSVKQPEYLEILVQVPTHCCDRKFGCARSRTTSSSNLREPGPGLNKVGSPRTPHGSSFKPIHQPPGVNSFILRLSISLSILSNTALPLSNFRAKGAPLLVMLR